MSKSETSTGTCRHCGREHSLEIAVDQFCSTECKYRDMGEKALNQVRNDHRFCGTCGGNLKDVEEPDEGWVNESKTREQFAIHNGGIYHNPNGQTVFDLTRCPDEQRTQTESVIGFQYTTSEAVQVLKEIEGPTKYDRREVTATGCICGCTDLSDTDETLRECQPARVLANYFRTLRLLEREGAIGDKLNKDAFFETYRETRDFELAIGRGLE